MLLLPRLCEQVSNGTVCLTIHFYDLWHTLAHLSHTTFILHHNWYVFLRPQFTTPLMLPSSPWDSPLPPIFLYSKLAKFVMGSRNTKADHEMNMFPIRTMFEKRVNNCISKGANYCLFWFRARGTVGVYNAFERQTSKIVWEVMPPSQNPKRRSVQSFPFVGGTDLGLSFGNLGFRSQSMTLLRPVSGQEMLSRDRNVRYDGQDMGKCHKKNSHGYAVIWRLNQLTSTHPVLSTRVSFLANSVAQMSLGHWVGGTTRSVSHLRGN